ncbi:MAG: transcription-repair coupling factor [Planctomycetes bacterium]|nr:transcription-repair coupling factor [Planctomycetota bacterium]
MCLRENLHGLIGAARSLAVGALGTYGRRLDETEFKDGGQGLQRAEPSGRPPHQHYPSPGSTNVVVAVVEGPDTALDMLADLRAWQAIEETANSKLEIRNPKAASAEKGELKSAKRGRSPHPQPFSLKWRGEPGRAAANPKSEIQNPKSEDWADHTLPANATLPEDLKAGLALETTLFPAWDVLPTESDRPEGIALAGRRRALERLREIRDPALNAGAAAPGAFVILAPMTALMQPCEPPSDPGAALVLQTGANHDPIALGRKLGELGFERVGQVEVRGEFSLRGGILDLFPYTAERPFRIDFFGDTIESIHPFDPLTQVSEGSVPAIAIADSSPERLRKLFSPGAAAGRPSTLFDHLPPDARIVWVDPAKLAQRADLYHASLVSGRSLFVSLKDLHAQGEGKFDTLDLLPPAGEEQSVERGAWSEERHGTDDGGDVERGAKSVERHGNYGGKERETPSAETSGAGVRSAESSASSDEPLAASPARQPGGEAARSTLHALRSTAVRSTDVSCTVLTRLHGEIAAHADAWKRLAAARMALYVFCETPGDRKRLETLLTESGVLPAPSVRFHSGKISGGFDLRACGIAAISDREILGRRKHAAAAPVKAKFPAGSRPLTSVLELQTGDYVVHAQHGIARYLGLARLEKSGRMEDYLTLLFDENVKLYVPGAHIHWVGKYIGGQTNPELAKLGSKAWIRKKERAQQAIRDIAEDLLKVQAARKSLPGIVYGPDGEWQSEFEQAFPYDETPDQLAAIEAIDKDMHATYPMDRLLCGDVGFGKTEVAVRAAFRTVMNGKQAAVLTPTTLLCEQHGRTFKERFAGYPVSVETLSRFKTPRQQKEILNRLATGRLDIVIGTHRVLQKDVRFKDLGLAIVDEEQRFGVEHKEFFKQLRKTVDVLTLSATPIPRTLHMAMLGLRDISNLLTPPRNRRSIATKVARVSDDLLRRAILREISRGGQVFVVHPRVHDIQDFASRVASLVPEARVGIGHGQLDADDLEAVMDRFLQGGMDVLVSTTIVESGLDIASANTILVHEADRFGLSELHQLRGRVGRSDIQAYCYLLLPEHSPITPEGLRRLRALEEFDELGAGFQLALKDLEIRGAGNVLGVEQSGQIAEVGYDLYCKLLDATVKQLKGEPPPEEEIEVHLQLRSPAYIPETYIEDEKAVLEFYRRLEVARTDEHLAALKNELADRFGPLPPETARLFEESKLRRYARAARVPYVGIEQESGRLILKLHGWDFKAADRALRGLPEVQGVRVLDDQTLSFGLSLRAKSDETALHQFVRNLLEPLAIWRSKHAIRAAQDVRPASVK